MRVTDKTWAYNESSERTNKIAIDVDLCIWRMEISFFFVFSSLPYSNCNSQWLSSSTSFSLSLCRDPTHRVPCTWCHVNFCSEYRDFIGFCFLKRNFYFQLHQFQIPKSRTEALQRVFFFIFFRISKKYEHIVCANRMMWLACIAPGRHRVHRAQQHRIFQSEMQASIIDFSLQF